jgi:predicted DNA-binding protein (UPF0251 family)
MVESAYVSIQEAARRCGVSSKTIQRAVQASKLVACYPKPNRCEIAISDLEAFRLRHLSGHAPSQVELRIAALERRVEDLERQLCDVLLKQEVSGKRRVTAKQKQIRTSGPLPLHLVSVLAFAELHRIPEQKVYAHIEISLLPVHRGAWTDHDGQQVALALDAKGQQAFHHLYHETLWFAPCKKCPHGYQDSVSGQ